jgi:acyl-lipid omega-6 desaturase (Delta-12 desaturase)
VSTMPSLTRREVIRQLMPYTRGSTLRGVTAFLRNFCLYWGGLLGVLFLPGLPLKILASLVMAVAQANMIPVGHDAAHRSLVLGKRLNWLLGVMSFTTCFWNYRMWIYDHHVQHHAFTNHEQHDTYTPFSKEQFDALPKWRKWLERFYRQPNPLSFGVYYIVERWAKCKVLPLGHVPAKFRPAIWRHFAFLVAYVAAIIALCAAAPLYSSTSSVVALVLGVFLPFLMSEAILSFMLWSMHTSTEVAWFHGDSARGPLASASELVSVHVRFPPWLAWATQDVNCHPVHHLMPTIPIYRAREAQILYDRLMGDKAVVADFSWTWLADTMSRCKLYDFVNNRWLDFDGRPTSGVTKPFRNPEEVSAYLAQPS